MKRTSPFPVHSYPWYVQDWRESRSRMTMDLETRAFYRELLDYCVTTGSFPADPKILAQIAMCSEAEATRLWPKVEHKFSKDGTECTNGKADEVRQLIQARKGKISNARRLRVRSEKSPRPLGDVSNKKRRRLRGSEGEGEGDGEGEVVVGSGVSEKTTNPEVFPDEIALSLQNSPIGAVFLELKSLYRQAGKPVAAKHENLAIQLLMAVPPDRLERVTNYVKWALVSGTWSDVAHTKSLLNLLRDGDWDVELTQRTLPQFAENRVRKAQDEARRQFEEGA